MQKILDKLVENVREDIPGYIAISIAEMASGESLHSHSSKPDFDPALACAYNVEIINAKRKAMVTLGLNENIKDIYFNLENEIHIVNLSPSGEYFIYLAVDSKKANLALTRTLLNRHKKELNNEL
ncbi:hypothetical protein [Tenacibaculum finnmarkense]|uniref:hypothetical protein n=1 Tax=Tenacibaculum finnmarkense TaxID=2781243 RepID=UPI00187B7096|nr:hypothetical protein [Tenacibaculum finnmarkense]MBE7647346.1 hypothetical protein [Tenacibaculum finnmarkense genomovar ulcerans]MCD8421464.1 hypothetical protein [Tenacibaculum finnmarkense genomovar ulcerans]MCG8237596.1 hypothetical protein [Tenacibaculum finnmarkense genomovar ulcerans]MCG8794549.1 hypothetical protein [Tenacibaculum finnmarkense]MCG8796878.1 hypothetical protein [Tenacibaculum finnmarkense]